MGRVAVHWVTGGGEFHSAGPEALDEAVAASTCWIDVNQPTQEIVDRLAGLLDLHPLVVEDALHVQVRPKLDLYADGPFLVWLSPNIREDGTREFLELDCLLRDRLLLTLHKDPLEAIDQVEAEAERVLVLGTDWALHGILDRLTDSMLPIADRVGDKLEAIEDRMLGRPAREDLDELYVLRRRLLRLHRVVSPQRDMIRALARERDFVSEEAFRYFDDVVDHLSRAEDALETYRDIASAVMDIYLSAQSNRLNEIMKVLTVITVVVGVMTLVSGIYGMNLIQGMWPPVGATWSFPLVIVIMFGLAGAMAIYYRKKNWW